MRETRLAFEALSIEGALLSPDWLGRVAQLQAGQQGESEYRIPKGLGLRDELSRYWRIAQAQWNEFSTGLGQNADPATLSQKFIVSLLRDAFGFGSLSEVGPVTVLDRAYAIGFSSLGRRVPVVIAPARFGLDTAAAQFGDGTRKRSAFGLAQEYLNALDEALWGLATDGTTLRLLRDNASLTRPAWIEADLARIFGEARFSDFAALWLLLHETRFGERDQPPGECPLEHWRKAGLEEGTRARDQLRVGVEEALLALGQGFLEHKDNAALREAFRNKTLDAQGFFQQLLRLIYRLLFLLTTEERGLLHPEDAAELVKKLYLEGYSLRRLRERALRRSAHDRYPDLWEAMKIVFRGLDRGEPQLGLPALAGIFESAQCAALDASTLENHRLLAAIFRLSWLKQKSGLARVNWRDMGPEELGSVYESLLELVPQLTSEGRVFSFANAGESKGNARKTTGSYYTPDPLVQVLLDSALEPVMQQTIAANPGKEVEALLSLTIVDPACGSGHFLLAAARRLAAKVAGLEAKGTPSGPEYRHALRRVVGRCVFGVDLMPMAVELCKVALWMEAVEPGRPLSFLDSHIQQGNALLGTTPELMKDGIPDDAWVALEGDDKKTVAALKKRNKKERDQTSLALVTAQTEAASVTAAVKSLDDASDADVAAVAKKQSEWTALLASVAFQHQRLVADAWCAAFVWPKESARDALAEAAPTNATWRMIRDEPAKVPGLTVQTVNALAAEYQFFHWPLRFPQVFARGGFDVVLGNPPWERVKLQEQEFFAARSDAIAGAENASARKKEIARLPKENPALWAEWSKASRVAEGQSHIARSSKRYPLCGKGDVNTYALFAEHNYSLLRERARAGFIVPTGIATDDTTKEYFGTIVSRKHLASFFGFENEGKLFQQVDHRVNFCLFVLSTDAVVNPVYSAFIRDPEQLSDSGRTYSLTDADISTINPNTKTCPVFRTQRDAHINIGIYRRTGVLWNESSRNGNPWGLDLMAMLHMANDSNLFRSREELVSQGFVADGNRFRRNEQLYVPLIESKMLYLFNHRFGDFALLAPGEREHILPQVPTDRLASASYVTTPRYWVPEEIVRERVGAAWQHAWLLGWRRVTDARSSVRTMISCIVPWCATGDSFFQALPSVEPALAGC